MDLDTITADLETPHDQSDKEMRLACLHLAEGDLNLAKEFWRWVRDDEETQH